MKSDQQVRLDCVKMAASLATSKVIEPNRIIETAEKMHTWIIGEQKSAREMLSAA